MLDFDDPDTYTLLLQTCKRYGVDPSVPIESEAFFRNLLERYEDALDANSVSSWLEKQLSDYFVAVEERPNWIQNPEWPIMEGKPLVFVGQVDISVPNKANIFHDDTSIYVFVGEKAVPILVLQQY